jgi:hypothetical protein
MARKVGFGPHWFQQLVFISGALGVVVGGIYVARQATRP